MTSSIDGLVSGLDTTNMIKQLMQVEAVPQNQLKTKISVQNKAVTAYQAVNTKLAALATAAKAVSSAETWGAAKTTSSSDAAIVTAKAGTPTGSLSFTVDAVAATHTETYTGGFVSSVSDPVMSGGTLRVLLKGNGGEVDINPADGSLQSVVQAINNTANAAYKAAAVQVSPGKYTLQLTATEPGAEGALTKAADAAGGAYAPFGLDLLGGAPTTTTKGTDAKLTVGDPGTGFTVTSASNTFNDVLPGLSITVTKKQTDTPVTVGVATDSAAVADKVAAMVEAAQGALSEISTATATKGGTNPAAGPLPGDTALRQLSQGILSAVAGGAGNLGSLSAVGINLDKTGTLSFDRDKFLTAYEADPVKTQAYFDSYTEVPHAKANPAAFDPGWDTADGLARKLQTLSVTATEGVIRPTDQDGTVKQGTLAGIISRRNETIKGLNDQVAAWDTRLELRKTNLERQFSGLEVALSKLQSQSSWLSGQLASLG
ncbi:flagellar filament capping protein FliD [Virgisporangium aurantiacum]|uniref:Flagellar hook-associated protein 2 n=1 Tax=Virgisporangium aurantiacum TaxID=175570 RepID=A0A8J3YZD7_9ACTN|nr:flagellar filament capping protein FliD [Virgisporangium aurantiacum]GIJ52506.1 flagellar hook-associated protein 2 [Virgisporangium aurantiacum]